MLRILQKSRIYQFCSINEFPNQPKNPTMYESFAEKIPKQDLEKFMNPMGFLKEDEIKEIEGSQQKKIVDYKLDQNGMPPETGFKVKGPEPTRYGDWANKGRVTDF